MWKKMLSVLLIIGMVGVAGMALADGDTNSTNSHVNGITDGQGQGQGQGQQINTTDNSVNNSKIYNRQFPIAGNVPTYGTNGFFTAPTPDSSFRQVKELIYALTGDQSALSVNLTEGALENLAKGGDVDANLQVVRAAVATAKADEDGVKWLTISYIAPLIEANKIVGVRKEELLVGGFADGEADDRETNSFMVIGKVGLKALKAGFNHLQITTEGAHRAVEASGWGVGLYTVGGSMSDSGKTAGLVGGGTGFAKNETSTEDRPWIHAIVGMNK